MHKTSLPQQPQGHSQRALASCSLWDNPSTQATNIPGWSWLFLAVKGWWTSTIFSELRDAKHFLWLWRSMPASPHLQSWALVKRQATPGKGDTYLSENISVTDSLMKTDLGRKLRHFGRSTSVGPSHMVLFWWFFNMHIFTEGSRERENSESYVAGKYQRTSSILKSERILCMLHRLCMLWKRATPISKLWPKTDQQFSMCCEHLVRVFSIPCLLFHRS